MYIGVTSDIRRRLTEHRQGRVVHTRRYGIHRLVFLEFHDRMTDAIVREKHLKKWLRAWKIELVEHANPNWDDLTHNLVWMN